MGWVALVGGGPGIDGLLTTRGYELLRAADVVVVDRLAPRAVVDRLPDSVRVIDVGKTPGHHAVPQWRINEILVEERRAASGSSVSRAVTLTSSAAAARSGRPARLRGCPSRWCPA